MLRALGPRHALAAEFTALQRRSIYERAEIDEPQRVRALRCEAAARCRGERVRRRGRSLCSRARCWCDICGCAGGALCGRCAHTADACALDGLPGAGAARSLDGTVIAGEAGGPESECWVRFFLQVDGDTVKAARFLALRLPPYSGGGGLAGAAASRAGQRLEGPPGTPADWAEELRCPGRETRPTAGGRRCATACFGWPVSRRDGILVDYEWPW